MQHVHPTFINNASILQWGHVADLVDMGTIFSTELQLRCPATAAVVATGKCRTLKKTADDKAAVPFLEAFLDVILYAMQALPKVAPSERPVLKEMLDGLKDLASDSWYNAALKEL